MVEKFKMISEIENYLTGKNSNKLPYSIRIMYMLSICR